MSQSRATRLTTPAHTQRRPGDDGFRWTGTANFGDTAGNGSLAGVVFDDNGAGGGAAGDGLRTGAEPGLGA